MSDDRDLPPEEWIQRVQLLNEATAEIREMFNKIEEALLIRAEKAGRHSVMNGKLERPDPKEVAKYHALVAQVQEVRLALMARCGDIMGLPNMFPADCTTPDAVRADSGPATDVTHQDRVVTAMPPGVEDMEEREITWRTASWKPRQMTTCKDCGKIFELSKGECPRCKQVPTLVPVQDEPPKRWYVGLKRAPFVAKMESGSSVVIFMVTPGYRILIPSSVAKEVNDRAPGALEEYRKKHGKLDSIPIGDPGHLRTVEGYLHRKKTHLGGRHPWRTWPPLLIGEVVRLRLTGAVPATVRLPAKHEYQCSMCENRRPHDGECKPESPEMTALERALSGNARWALRSWCSTYDRWGRLIRLPSSLTDAHNAYVVDLLVKRLRTEHGRFDTDKAFIQYVSSHWAPILSACGFPAKPTQLRAILVNHGVLNARNRRKQ